MVFTSVKLNDGFTIEKPNILRTSLKMAILQPLLTTSRPLDTITNNKNKYKTYIAHIQYKYFHMRITNDRIKSISQLKAMCIDKSVKKLS